MAIRGPDKQGKCESTTADCVGLMRERARNSRGALSITGCSLLPSLAGAATLGPPCLATHLAQSSHQVPVWSVAFSFHSCGSLGLASFVQCLAFGPGGLTIPAMCPDVLSTNRLEPPNSCVVL